MGNNLSNIKDIYIKTPEINDSDIKTQNNVQ